MASFRFQAFRYDASTGELYRDGEPVFLRPRTAELLGHLVANPRRVVSKDEIAARVWKGAAVQDDTIRTSIWELRNALGDDRKAPKFIQTVYRRGVRFLATLEVVASGDGGRERGSAAAGELPFLGREAVLTELEKGYRAADSGAPQLHLIGGAAGLGKTRLLREFVDAHHAHVLRARGREASRHWPFWLCVQLVRSFVRTTPTDRARRVLDPHVGDLATLMPSLVRDLGACIPESDTARFSAFLCDRIFDAVLAMMRSLAAERPLLVAIDDLHLVGPSSLGVLSAILDEMIDERILLLGSYRSGMVDAPEDFRAFLQSCASSPRARLHALSPLAEEDVRRILEASTPNALDREATSRIVRVAAGNPCVMREQLASVRDDVRSARTSIRAGLEERVASVSESARTLLSVGSLIGNEFDLSVVGASLHWDDEAGLRAAAEAVESELAREALANPLVLILDDASLKPLLRERMSSLRRRYYHLRIANVIEDRSGLTPETLPILARHYAEAAPPGDLHRALDLSLQVGLRAIRSASWEEAYASSRRILPLLPHVDASCAALLPELQRVFCLSCRKTGRSAESHRAAGEFFTAGRRIGDRDGSRRP